MAFFRFNRDKRGYEHFYLVEPIANRRGKSRPRVLYWYRTPPNIRVGRVPFDPEVQRALEAQNPNVVFDWRKIIDAPIPSADVEKWRERRRAERAEKASRRVAPAADVSAEAAAEGAVVEPEADDEDASDTIEAALSHDVTPAADAIPGSPAIVTGDPNVSRKRRRRRRRRGRRPELLIAAPASATATGSTTAPEPANATESLSEPPPDAVESAPPDPGESTGD